MAGKTKQNYYQHAWVGYMPMYWIEKASKVGGDKTILFCNVLWMFWSMKYLKSWLEGKPTKNVIYINDYAVKQFGISPSTRTRCLKRLEKADLVSIVELGVGKRPAILIKFINVRKPKDQT